MAIARYLFIVSLILCLTACLKVTGAAKDPFDLEEEQSSGFKTTVFNDRNDDESQPEAGNEDRATEQQIPNEPADAPATPSASADRQEFEDFQKWKNERNAGSAEYQEFKEYQEYKLWLEFQQEKGQ